MLYFFIRYDRKKNVYILNLVFKQISDAEYIDDALCFLVS